MAIQTYYSVLNTVASASGDISTVAGLTKITGLPAFDKDTCIATKAAATTFTTLDTNATISASGATLTWTTNPTTSITGEVLEVSKAGVTYLAYIITGGSGATVTVGWIGANGTPADAAGYTVVRKGATFTKVVFAAPAAVTNYNLGVKFISSAVAEPTKVLNWEYTSTASTAAADLQDSFYTWANTLLSGSGYFVAKNSTTTVIIYNPTNATFSITPVTASGFTSPTVTQYATATKSSGAIKGYGADLIAREGYPVSSTPTANDGIVSTANYTVYDFVAQNVSPAGVLNSVQYALLINVGSANSSTLIGTLDSTFGT